MKFGSSQMFEYIKFNLANTVDESWYERLYDVIKCDVLSILSSYKLQKADKEDIMQEVQWAVTKNLVQFVRDSEMKNVWQRNAWLKTITERKLIDFFRKKYKCMEVSIDDLLLDLGKHKKYLSHDNVEKYFDENTAERKIIHLLSILFSLNTRPEKIIAFVFNRILGTTSHERKNGSPLDIVAKFNGVKIQEMSKIMKVELQRLFSFSIPVSIYAPLDQKIKEVTQHGDEEILFVLSPRGITDSSNWITKKIKEKEEEIINDAPCD